MTFPYSLKIKPQIWLKKKKNLKMNTNGSPFPSQSSKTGKASWACMPENTRRTEFMIGPLFLTAGVSAFDLIMGLLVGNLLAVLSWRFLTAEIAVNRRLTLYFQLEKSVAKNW